MTPDNTKFGYYCSLALHISVSVAAIVSVLVSSIFKSEPHPIDPNQVFEMVEPPEPAAEAPAQAETAPEAQPDLEQDLNLEPVEPIELPDPAPEPEPTPPAPKPEPTPAPTPKPPKKPKVEKKPEPKPQKISWADYNRKNPKKPRKSAQTPRTQAPVKVGKISAKTGNIDNIAKVGASISGKAGTSAAMKNMLAAYIGEIKRKAESNWAIPVTAQNSDLSAKVEFRVSKNGEISGLRIIRSSGNAEVDNSILAALRSISLTPPPDNEPHHITITFSIL